MEGDMRITIDVDPTIGVASMASAALSESAPVSTLAPTPSQALDAGCCKEVTAESGQTSVETPQALVAGSANVAPAPPSAKHKDVLSLILGAPQMGEDLDAGSA
jgi:hypothetical protein